ncbi:MAG: D-2-hydroxyacid dehydrogenase [Anaerolineae bacterium]|nr:D-2-hydroxyacid dehydrogenase [Anaerolineae bacterium]CAG1004784.1 glyoxylate reductase [Anaerolineae bacterium]
MNDTLNVLILVDFGEDLLSQIRALSPKLNLIRKSVSSPAEIPPEVWASADILYTTVIVPEAEVAPRLRWVQAHYAGVDKLLSQPLFKARPDLMLTSASGIHASTIAEYSFAMMLALARKIPLMLRMQKQAAWTADRFELYLPTELRGATLGILGYGSIGRATARLANAFGMQVLATKRDVKRPSDGESYEEPGIGDPEGTLVDRLYPPEALKSMVSQCDFVVVTLPLTLETKGYFGAEAFAVMKKNAVLINVARGGIVDEEALIAALQNKQIAGAGLDVFEEEPLPAKSPLWAMENVIISPHIAGNTSRYHERAAAMFVENLRRYLNKNPLLNRVETARGY